MCILEGKQAMLSGTAEFNKAASRAYKALNQEDKDELVESTAKDYECDNQPMSIKTLRGRQQKSSKRFQIW